jgi:Domain of unknown function (DUF6457)
MAEWIDELAEALGDEPLSPDETRELLAAARDVAHRTERRVTPLSTFLVGIAVGRAGAAGNDRTRALAETLGRLRASLPSTGGAPEAG